MASMDRPGPAAVDLTKFRPETIALAALGVILAIAAYTRFVGMGVDSIWRDEAVSWVEAHGNVVDVIAATAHDNYPPLHNLLLAASMHLFGDSEWALRLPSAILGFANVLGVYWVGTMVGGRKAGIIAALLLTFSPFHIWYSQEARNYTLLALTATLFVGAAFWLRQQATLPRVVATLAAGITLLYSHPYGTIIWLCVSAAVLVDVIVRPGPNGPSAMVWVLLQVAVGLAFAPWAWVLMGRAHHIQQDGFWIAYPTPGFIVEQLRALASGGPVLTLLSLAGLSAFVPLPPRFAVRYAPPHLWIIAVWLFSSLVVGIGLSLVGTPIFVARYAIGSLPAFVLLAALGMARFANGWRNGALVAAFAAAVCVLALVFGQPARHEDWRTAAAYVADNLPAGGCVLAPGRGHRYAFDYYARGRVACLLDPVTAPVRIDSDFFVVVLTPEWSRGLLTHFQLPRWKAQKPLEFSGVEVFPFQRVR